jgi:hypothetical protein
MRSGLSSRISFATILANPKMAFVGCPRDVDNAGSAWNARYTYPLPSIRCSRGPVVDAISGYAASGRRFLDFVGARG